MANPSSLCSDELCFRSAKELAHLIRTRKVSAAEVMAAHLERIEAVNPRVNAIVAKLDDDECMALARIADERMAKGDRELRLAGYEVYRFGGAELQGPEPSLLAADFFRALFQRHGISLT